nr:MAG TPA: CtsR-like protein [Bacteriophage sp.]
MDLSENTKSFERRLVTGTTTGNAVDLKREVASNFGCKPS